MAPFWPVELKHNDLVLRPLRYLDRNKWKKLRNRNLEWLGAWEATVPKEFGSSNIKFFELVRNLKIEAKNYRALPFVMQYKSDICGQLTVANINYGSARNAHIGYWIAKEFAGKGLTPLAVAMAIDYCFDELQLHRIEIAIRPENVKSLRVVEKLGLRSEGLRPSFLHINGEWRDHLIFAMVRSEHTHSLVSELEK